MSSLPCFESLDEDIVLASVKNAIALITSQSIAMTYL